MDDQNKSRWSGVFSFCFTTRKVNRKLEENVLHPGEEHKWTRSGNKRNTETGGMGLEGWSTVI
jgi:hypothetical protein